MIFYQNLLTISLRKCLEISWENLYVDIKDFRGYMYAMRILLFKVNSVLKSLLSTLTLYKK